MSKKEEKMKRFLNEGHLALLVGISAFTYFLYIGLNRESITSPKDLVEIEGAYEKHSFKDNTGFKNFTHEYYIWTDNHRNTFQIKADYLNIFNRKNFLSNINLGDKIKFTIPSKSVESLDSKKNIQVTSIEVEGNTYLDKNKVLEIERDIASSKDDYFIGAGFLIAGLFGYLRKRK
ncbi:hypothetical protein [Rufibacter tibetensis]|uniref:Uncharacterized protein n=1 Tax=Rufibacter tibetensis TaxID=512763 RepID=A0A0N7HX04_9BACT|nr:hypothetical protein [Rufibacter tibetensis]ALJ00697.1 hypothetical protein DC20_19085 [Rufibacter tibetensis]